MHLKASPGVIKTRRTPIGYHSDRTFARPVKRRPRRGFASNKQGFVSVPCRHRHLTLMKNTFSNRSVVRFSLMLVTLGSQQARPRIPWIPCCARPKVRRLPL